MSELVVMQDNNIYTTTLIISENLGMDHKSIVKLLKDHSDIDELKRLGVAKVSTKGRAILNYLLSEEQALILVSLMKNTPKVIEFKVRLVKSFIKYRKLAARLLAQKHNAEFIDKRKESKVMRRECTDIIQEFIVYAKEQGSKSADKYYMNFSRLVLNGLFILEGKFPNSRDIMTIKQLNITEAAEQAISDSLQESMAKKISYKDCYKEAKARIEQLARIFPPSPLPYLLPQDLPK